MTGRQLLAAHAGRAQRDDAALEPHRPDKRFALAGLSAATASACFFIWLLLGISGEHVTKAVDDTGEGLAAALAAIGCLAAARRASSRERRVWLLFGLAATAWTLGQAIWCYYDLVLGRPPAVGLDDVLFLLAVPVALAGTLTLFEAPAGLISRVRATLDALIIASATLLLSWLIVLKPILYNGTGGAFAQAVTLAYPLGDVVLLSTLVIVAVRSRKSLTLPLGWFATALVCLTVSDSVYAIASTNGNYSYVGPADAGWVIGFLILALATIKPPGRPLRSLTQGHRALLAYVPVVVAIGVLIVRMLEGDRLERFGQGVLLVLLALIVVQQLFALRENRVLTAGLERKVTLRTLELRASEERLRSLIQNVSDVVALVDAEAKVSYVSPSIVDVSGYDPTQVVGRNLLDFVHPDDLPTAIAFFKDQAASADGEKRRDTLRMRMRTPSGEWHHTETLAARASDEAQAGQFVLTTRDVTDRTRLEQQLEHQAFHDPLTQLANRALFANRVEHELERSRRTSQPLAVILVDLDEFKAVNDTLGHDRGDELLREVAQRMTASARPGDTVARLGGDEFAILLENCDEDAAIRITERFQAALAEPIVVADHAIVTSASAGIAVAGPRTETVAELLRNADIAMYRAKAAGKAGYQVFRAAMRDEVVRRVGLQSDLRQALARGELELHYQPLVELSTDRIVAFEALSRWRHPVRGLVAPPEFIPVAEETGLSIPFGSWVLRQAISQLASWRSLSSVEIGISVNVSARQFSSPELVATIRETLERNAVPPSCVTLELTESVLLRDVRETTRKLEALKALGVRLAVDDFGTGFSSVSCLQRLPVDELKIDRSFVEQIPASRRAGELVSSIVALGGALGLETVAEGVELEPQSETLREIGCRLGQGYLLGRPRPADQITPPAIAGRITSVSVADTAVSSPSSTRTSSSLR